MRRSGTIRSGRLRTWQRVLARSRGKEGAAAVVRQVHERFDSLLGSDAAPTAPALQPHLNTTLLPLLALYQVFLGDWGDKDRALAETEACLHAEYARRIRLMPLFGRLPGSYALLKWIAWRMLRAGFPVEGWETKIVADTRDCFEFHTYRCFYHDILRRYGAPELTSVLCKTDDWLAEALAPAIRWERTGTLGRGDDHCDFCYRRGS